MRRTDEIWKGGFGDDYVSRNPSTVLEMDRLTEKNFGITRTAVYLEMIDGLSFDRILHVGCSVGNILGMLSNAGHDGLYGIDINPMSVRIARNRGFNVLEGNVFELPFRDRFFDLVITDGVLIHINPRDLKMAMDEICRVSRRYVIGFEYYDKEGKMIRYRGLDNMLWKNDYCGIYHDSYDCVDVVKSVMLEYLDGSGNVDNVFLLEKNGACKDYYNYLRVSRCRYWFNSLLVKGCKHAKSLKCLRCSHYYKNKFRKVKVR